jgi:hypothetical protein
MVKLLIFIIIIVTVFMPFTVLSDERTNMKDTAIWPSGAADWKLSMAPECYDSKTAFKYMNGAAELYLAYNLRQLTVLRYEKPGRPSITTEFFDMGSSEDAFGVFSFEQQDIDAGIGQGSEFGGGLLRFWKGRYFVSIYPEEPGNDVENAIPDIGRQLSSVIKETGNAPRLLAYLPDKGFTFTEKKTWFVRSHILLNQRFFISHQNILSLSPDTEAALARYDTGKEKVYFLLIRYPSQARAEAALSSFVKSYMPDASQQASVKTENGKWTKAGQLKEFVLIVFDAPDELLAERLLKKTINTLSGKNLPIRE